MSNDYSQQTPKRPRGGAGRSPRGRPKGSLNASTKLHNVLASDATTAEAIEQLAAMSPAMPPEKFSARMNPVQWDAERRRLLLELLNEGDDPEVLKFFLENPAKFSPEGINLYKIMREEFDRITAERADASVWVQEITDMEAKIASEEAYRQEVVAAGLKAPSKAFVENLKAALCQLKETHRRLFQPTAAELTSPERASWLASIKRGKKLLAQITESK